MASQSTLSSKAHSVGAVRRSSFGNMTAWVFIFVALFNLFSGSVQSILWFGKSNEEVVSKAESGNECLGHITECPLTTNHSGSELDADVEDDKVSVKGECTSENVSPIGLEQTGADDLSSQLSPDARKGSQYEPSNSDDQIKRNGNGIHITLGPPFSRFGKDKTVKVDAMPLVEKNLKKVIDRVCKYRPTMRERKPYVALVQTLKNITTIELPADIAYDLWKHGNQFKGFFLWDLKIPDLLWYLAKMLAEDAFASNISDDGMKRTKNDHCRNLMEYLFHAAVVGYDME